MCDFNCLNNLVSSITMNDTRHLLRRELTNMIITIVIILITFIFVLSCYDKKESNKFDS